MALDNFEQELFDDLNDYQSELNKVEAWEELEEKLPTEQKRRKPFFWWFTGIGVCVLIVGGMLMYSNFNGVDLENTIAQENSTDQNNIATTSLNKSDEENSSSEKETAPITNENIIANETVTLASTELKTQSKKDISTPIKNTISNSKHNILSPSQHTTINNRTVTNYQPQFKETITPTLFENKVINTNSNQISVPTDNQINILDNAPIIISEKEIEKEDINTTKTQNAPTESPIVQQQIEVDNAIEIQPTNNNKTIATEEKEDEIDDKNKEAKEIKTKQQIAEKQSQKDEIHSIWLFAISGTYGFSSYQRSSDWRNELERSIDYVGINFKVYRQLNKHISIFSGITASQHTNLFENNTRLTEMREENVIVEERYYISGDTDYILDQGITPYDIAIQSKLWQRYRAISIPIGIAVQIKTDKKWQFQNDLAFVISPIQSISGQKVFSNDSVYNIFDNSNYPTVLFYGISDQLSLNYEINNKFTLQLQGDFGLDLTTRIKGQELYEMKFMHLGLGFGGVWRL